MKNQKLVILIIALMVTFSSCSSLESDAKKLAKMQYDLEQTGNNVGSRSNVYASKADKVLKFQVKTWDKYSKKPETKEKFRKVFEQELERLRK